MSTSLRKRIRRVCLLGCGSGAALLVLAGGQASAAVYPGGGSTFTGSAEGWTGKTECQSITKVVPVLLCEGSAGYMGAVGSPAGSFDGTTELTLNLLGAFDSVETAVSPNFTAVAGGSGTLRLDRQFAPEGLLQMAPHVEYGAYLVDRTSGGSKQRAIAETIAAEAPFGAKSGTVTLIAGHTYAIEVVAKIGSTVVGLEGLKVLGKTSFRIDNVAVTGPGGEGPVGPEEPGCAGCGGGNGGEGGEGGPGGGAGGVSGTQLESLIRSSLLGPAVLKGNRLSVKAACPAKVGATCTISLQGMLSRHKPATVGRKAKVKTGKTKKFVLSVKAAARATVKTRSKLLFKETVEAGTAKATVYKSLKLIRG